MISNAYLRALSTTNRFDSYFGHIKEDVGGNKNGI